MEALILDPGALRKAYRDSITTLHNNVVYRKNVDESMAAESCFICTEDWQIGEEAVTLRCECPYWAHEACLAKAAFETSCCPTCRTSMASLDEDIVLTTAAGKGDLTKVRDLLEKGVQPSPRSIFDSTPLLAAAEGGHHEIIRLLVEHGASVAEQDRYQRTALYWASKGGHQKTVAPDSEDPSLTLPTLHVVKCVQLLKQCKRLTSLRLYFERDLINNISPNVFKADPGIRELCFVRGIERVEIWGLDYEPLEQRGLVKWLKEEMKSSEEEGEDEKGVGKQDTDH